MAASSAEVGVDRTGVETDRRKVAHFKPMDPPDWGTAADLMVIDAMGWQVDSSLIPVYEYVTIRTPAEILGMMGSQYFTGMHSDLAQKRDSGDSNWVAPCGPRGMCIEAMELSCRIGC